MDTDPEPGKSSGMSFSMKYNPNYEEVEHIISDVAPISNKANPHETTTSIDDLGKSKKNDKSGSIINKYFKTFKTEKGLENESKSESEVIKDNIERKSLDIRNESSGSPIKEYFSKFSKRSDSIDTTTSSEVESIKDGKDNSDRWKLFSDFKYKIAQAVEDIKSSRSSEATDIKEKQGSVDNSSITDSEDQELDPISCASTENQVSSLTSSVQNLSELSPPIISHSSTMTDMDLETTSTSDTNKISTDTSETKQKYQGPSKIKSVQYEDSDIDDNEHMEIESGVEALEDAELVLQNDTTDDILKSPVDQPSVFVKPPMALNLKKDIRRKTSFFSYSLICFTGVVLISLSVFPTILMFNGFLIGAWFTYFLNKSYVWILEILGHENNISPSAKAFIVPDFQHMSISNIPHIVEFEPLKKYEGWTNVYMMGKYDVLTYHISLTQTAFMKLEGSTLRLSFTHNKIPKRGLWNEVLQKVPFYQHRIYNLEGAKIKLLPLGIVKKRHWSKKYPICIILKDKSKMTVYNAKSNSSDTNLPTKDNPNLPLYSKDDINFPYTEQEVKNDTSLIESKSIIEDEDSKIKSSPRRGLKLFDRITEKSVTDSPTRSEETAENKKDSSSTRTSSKPIFIKSNKNKDRENMFSSNLDESSFKDNMESVFDDEEPPEIKEMVSISYMDAINNDQKSETNYYGDLKDIIKHNTDEDGTTMETVVLNNEWSKDDAIDGEQNHITLYLFGRTGREKEEWFRRIKIAIDDVSIKQTSEIEQIYNNPDEDDNDVTKNNEPYDNLGDELSKLLSSSKENSDSKVRMGSIKSERKSVGSNEMPSVLWTPNSSLKESPLSGKFYAKQDVDFWRYMKDIIEAKSNLEMSEKEIKMSNDVLWFNALFGRIIFDTFRNEAWVTMLQERIQKKLTSLKLPPFMGPLVVTALEFGAESPRIHGASSPILDSRGLWIDLQISYNGKATMTLMTQLNLMSLIEKRDGIGEEMEEKKSHSKKSSEKDLHAVYHSDLDDTAESSSEDEAVLVQLPAPKASIDVDSPPTPPANIGSSSAKKLMRYVDKIASNKYFQHVTEYKYVKRAMEGVSNTDLKLSVDLCGLVGCLSINIPPPPSDRIWFGFRGNPNLWLKAKPIVGSRVINFTHVTNWIEKKLCKEFEKVLVLPNMEDIYLDSMVAPYID